MDTTLLDPDTQNQRRTAAPPRARAPLHVAGGRAPVPSPGKLSTAPAPDGHEHPLATAHF
jgi:hypothetical protein